MQPIMVSALEPSADGPTALVHGKRTPIFLGQTREVNGSPAALCVLMALLAMGDIPRDECWKLAVAGPTERFRRVWPWIVRDYLVGADTNEIPDLVRMLSLARSSITFGKNGRASRWIVRHLRSRCWVITGFDSDRKSLEHWALVVGYELRSPTEEFALSDALHTLYLLDPTLPAPRDVGWNATFAAASERPGQIAERGKRPYTARLCGAAAIHWKPMIMDDRWGRP